MPKTRSFFCRALAVTGLFGVFAGGCGAEGDALPVASQQQASSTCTAPIPSARKVDIATIRSAVTTTLAKAQAVSGPSPDGSSGTDWVDFSKITDSVARRVLRLRFGWDGVSKRSEQLFRMDRSMKLWQDRLSGADADKNGFVEESECSGLTMSEVRAAIGVTSACDTPISDTAFKSYLRQIFVTEHRELRITDFYTLAWLGHGVKLSNFQAEVFLRVLHERGALNFVANVADRPLDAQMLTIEALRSSDILWNFLPEKFTKSNLYYDHMDTIPTQHAEAAREVGVDFRMAPAAAVDKIVTQFIDPPMTTTARDTNVQRVVTALNLSTLVLTERDAVDLLRAAFGSRADRVQLLDNIGGGRTALFATMQTVRDQLAPPMLHESHPRAQAYRDANRAAWRSILKARKELNRKRPLTWATVPDMSFDFVIPPALGELLPADEITPVPAGRKIRTDEALAEDPEDDYLGKVSGFNAYLKQYLPSAVLPTLDQNVIPAGPDGLITSEEFNGALTPQSTAAWRWGGPRDFDPSHIPGPYEMGYPYPWKKYTIGPNPGIDIELPFSIVPRAMRQIRDALTR